MLMNRISFLFLGAVLIAAIFIQTSCNNNSNNQPTLMSIAVTPASPMIAAGATQQFTAIGTFSDSSTQNLTGTVTWTSSTPAVATIVTGGLATAVATGSSTITATFGAISGTATLTVSAASPTLVTIAVTPASPTIAVGAAQQFLAIGTFSDSSTQDLTGSVTWTSSDSTVATITAGGLATAVATGTSTITATSGAISGAATLTVSTTPPTLMSIGVTPQSPTIAAGATQQFLAIGTYSDLSTQDLTGSVTWTSSDSAVATIVATDGLATAVAVGSSTITATSGAASGAISGTATLTVSATPPTLMSIAVTPATPTIGVSATEQFTAIGTYSDSSTQDLTGSVVWTSSNTAVATILTPDGLATAVGAGSSTITAAFGAISGTATLTVSATPPTLLSITVTPSSPTIAVGATQQFTATANFDDGTTQDFTGVVVWTSSSTGVATILTPDGLATAVGAGSTTITAETIGSISGTATLNVTP